MSKTTDTVGMPAAKGSILELIRSGEIANHVQSMQEAHAEQRYLWVPIEHMSNDQFTFWMRADRLRPAIINDKLNVPEAVQRKNPNWAVEANADLIVKACAGLGISPTSTPDDRAPLDRNHPDELNPDRWPTFDDLDVLADTLGVEKWRTPREAVIALFDDWGVLEVSGQIAVHSRGKEADDLTD